MDLVLSYKSIFYFSKEHCFPKMSLKSRLTQFFHCILESFQTAHIIKSLNNKNFKACISLG